MSETPLARDIQEYPIQDEPGRQMLAKDEMKLKEKKQFRGFMKMTTNPKGVLIKMFDFYNEKLDLPLQIIKL